jgi:peptide deformylase
MSVNTPRGDERQARERDESGESGERHEGGERQHDAPGDSGERGERQRDERVQADEAPALDPELEARRIAAMSFIHKLGDPVLKSSATPVDRFDDSLRRQVRRMAGIMNDAIGVGLAAPQLGISQRLLVYRVGPDAPLIALANPEVEWASKDRETLDEGCLSIPGITVDVERPLHVRVRAKDEHGEERLVEASGLEARVLQHEMDHLDGVLILDRTSRDERKRALRELREAERQREAA